MSDEPDDEELFSLDNVKVAEWVSKDRRVATIRISDRSGVCDMKLLLTLKAKVEQMEMLLGFCEGDDTRH
jgi:hypothetical protein